MFRSQGARRCDVRQLTVIQHVAKLDLAFTTKQKMQRLGRNFEWLS